MSKLVLAAIAALFLGWAPDNFQRQTWAEIQALTRAAPTAATEGVSLAGIRAVTITIAAEGGETLSGGGSVDLWGYDPATGWVTPDYAWAMTGCGGKASCQYTRQVLEPFGRFLPAASGITVSGGTTVTITITLTVSGSSQVWE